MILNEQELYQCLQYLFSLFMWCICYEGMSFHIGPRTTKSGPRAQDGNGPGQPAASLT
jgi:hypothetical protein